MILLRKNYTFEDIFLKNFINLSAEEKELVREWRNNKDIRKWMRSDKIISIDDHSNFINRLRNDNINFYWLVIINEQYIGVIYLNRIDFKNKNAYLGIYANPVNHFKGKGSLLIKCLKKLAFDIAKLHTLKLEVIENNKKAIHLYEKFGFNEKGRLKYFILKNEEWYDAIIMELVRN